MGSRCSSRRTGNRFKVEGKTEEKRSERGVEYMNMITNAAVSKTQKGNRGIGTRNPLPKIWLDCPGTWTRGTQGPPTPKPTMMPRVSKNKTEGKDSFCVPLTQEYLSHLISSHLIRPLMYPGTNRPIALHPLPLILPSSRRAREETEREAHTHPYP